MVGPVVSVAAGPICLELCQMFFRPATNCLKRFHKCAPERSQSVFDPRRHDRVHFALHQPVSLQPPECLRQHFLGDAADLSLQLRITVRPGREHVND